MASSATSTLVLLLKLAASFAALFIAFCPFRISRPHFSFQPVDFALV